MSRILALDRQGHPQMWVSQKEAIIYHAKNLVAWQLNEGEDSVLFRGGLNRITGKQSSITTAPIIAIKGEAKSTRFMSKIPSLTNSELFARDRFTCAYCGRLFATFKLTRDHIVPVSRGGRDAWTNCVSACEPCNHRKNDQLLEECGMELLYVPYTPTHAEALILENRQVLTCQMEYLRGFIPKHSRVWLS